MASGISKALKKAKNWNAPRKEIVHYFGYKYLTCLHTAWVALIAVCKVAQKLTTTI